MVLMTMMAQCLSGAHETCPGHEAAPPGEFGGVICDCSCHVRKPAATSYNVEEDFWQALKDGDPSDLELYLQQFPDGRYAALARSRLAELKRRK